MRRNETMYVGINLRNSVGRRGAVAIRPFQFLDYALFHQGEVLNYFGDAPFVRRRTPPKYLWPNFTDRVQQPLMRRV